MTQSIKNPTPPLQYAVQLLESVADLHLGNIKFGEWLQRMANMTECAAACSVSWTIGEPDTVIFDYSDTPILIDQPWIAAADKLIAAANPDQPALLDDLARSADALPAAPEDPLNNPNLLIGFLDTGPARTLLMFRCDDKPKGWAQADRERFDQLLPTLLKAHLVHKKLIVADNRLDVANSILQSAPRAVVSFTKDLKILRANAMAQDILDLGDIFSEDDGLLVINNDDLLSDINRWLSENWSMSRKDLEKVDWHRSLRSKSRGLTYQLTLRAYKLKKWHLESSAHERFATLLINMPEVRVSPTQAQLKEFYGLTRAQARLVLALLNGGSIADASELLNVSINTSRSHLRAIYNKLGVDNKAELLRLLSATLAEYTSTHKKLRI
jgi:DNA-binding CsgD family transcriptional regulator